MVLGPIAKAVGLGPRVSSVPPTPPSQCELMDDELKKQYGDDYLTNRSKFPITSEGLSTIRSVRCENYFKWSDLVDEFCADTENFTKNIGGGLTCKSKDEGNEARAAWCGKDGVRLKTNGDCSKPFLGDKYDSTATKFCKENPGDKWCSCYNLANNVCADNANAAGCKKAHDVLDDNKEAFKDGYDILKEKTYCRPRVCDYRGGYVPTNVMSTCASSYKMCNKKLDIRNLSNNDIVVECNGELGDLELPEWWDDEDDGSFWDEDPREPPFDSFPLNLTPIRRLPYKYSWKDPNFRYIVYGVIIIVVVIILIIMLMR